MTTISINVLLKSDLITTEESYDLIERSVINPPVTATEILELDLPAKNRVEALLQPEFLSESQLRTLAIDFTEHTLHIFESHALTDYRPRRCVDVARLHLAKQASINELETAIREARPSMWQFQRTEHESAFYASYAALMLNFEDAAEMVRQVAIYAQKAAHRDAWESKKSNVEPMIAREIEAAWQLEQILKFVSLS